MRVTSSNDSGASSGAAPARRYSASALMRPLCHITGTSLLDKSIATCSRRRTPQDGLVAQAVRITRPPRLHGLPSTPGAPARDDRQRAGRRYLRLRPRLSTPPACPLPYTLRDAVPVGAVESDVA